MALLPYVVDARLHVQVAKASAQETVVPSSTETTLDENAVAV